jgi:5-methylthioadenosine/S-adenosylhomocysteine deaminase
MPDVSLSKSTVFKNAMICVGQNFEFIKGHMVVRDGRIHDIIETGKQIDLSKFENSVDCAEYVITPGFVNCHVHLNQLLNRTMLDGLGEDELLESMHGRHYKKDDNDRYWASLLSIEEALESGTTFLWAFATDTSRIAEAMHTAGIRGAFTIAKKDTWLGNEHSVKVFSIEDIMKQMQKKIESWNYPLITPVLGFASERASSEQLLMKLGKLAINLNLRVNMHIAEGENPVKNSIKYRQKSSVEYLSQFDFFNKKLSLIHAIALSEEEIEIVAKKGISICHCPISNTRTGVGLMNLKSMNNFGINVGLGTDAASSGNTNNILLEAYCAILLHNSFQKCANAISAKEAFKMLTINGAKMIGLENQIGQLKKGFYADFVLWPIKQPLMQPFYPDNIINLIIFSGGQVKPKYVYVNGKLIFENNSNFFNLTTAINKIHNYASVICG